MDEAQGKPREFLPAAVEADVVKQVVRQGVEFLLGLFVDRATIGDAVDRHGQSQVSSGHGRGVDHGVEHGSLLVHWTGYVFETGSVFR